MPLTPSFTAVQSFNSPSNLTFTDTSTGSDISVASRSIYIEQANGDYIIISGNTNDYTTWYLQDVSATFDILDKDYAVTITVNWVDQYNNVLYTYSDVFAFTNFNEKFDYGLTQMLTANPMLINDNDFFKNKEDLRISIDSGNQAFDMAGDLFAAQQCYDRGTNLRENSQYYFNINS